MSEKKGEKRDGDTIPALPVTCKQYEVRGVIWAAGQDAEPVLKQPEGAAGFGRYPEEQEPNTSTRSISRSYQRWLLKEQRFSGSQLDLSLIHLR